MHRYCAQLLFSAPLILNISLNSQPSFAAAPASAPTTPPLMLAQIFHEGIAVTEYWISEKLDGVRAYWTGRELLSRNGRQINVPSWFTRGFPAAPLDGELWIDHQQFDAVSAAVRRLSADETEWQGIRFHVFDLPSEQSTFDERLAALTDLVRETGSPYLRIIPQYRLHSQDALTEKLKSVTAAGAEGLMLHHRKSHYQSGRTDALLKLKPYMDAEATVIAHLPGHGKYTGMMGSLLVETPEGLRFKIGTGFSDAQRQTPPAVGTRISFAYHGLTSGGIPRFASFIRVREPE